MNPVQKRKVVIGVSVVLGVSFVTLLLLWQLGVFDTDKEEELKPGIATPPKCGWSEFQTTQRYNSTGMGSHVSMNSSGRNIAIVDSVNNTVHHLKMNDSLTYDTVQAHDMGGIEVSTTGVNVVSISSDGRHVAVIDTSGRVHLSTGNDQNPFLKVEIIYLVHHVATSIHFDPGNPNRLFIRGSSTVTSNAGAIFSYLGTTKEWTISNGTTRANDRFGSSFHINGLYMIATYPLDKSAIVFKRSASNSVFEKIATVTAPSVSSDFPSRVAISSDGKWALLSDPTRTVDGVSGAGAVTTAFWNETSSVFDVTDSTKHIYQPTPEQDGGFGSHLNVLEDDLVHIGYSGNGTKSDKGYTWIYTYSDSVFSLNTQFEGSFPDEGDQNTVASTSAFGKIHYGRVRLVFGQIKEGGSGEGSIHILESQCV